MKLLEILCFYLEMIWKVIGVGPGWQWSSSYNPALKTVEIDSQNTATGYKQQYKYSIKIRYSTAFPINLRRIGYPENIDVIFSDVILDTSVADIGAPARPVKFTVKALTDYWRN